MRNGRERSDGGQLGGEKGKGWETKSRPTVISKSRRLCNEAPVVEILVRCVK